MVTVAWILAAKHIFYAKYESATLWNKYGDE